MLNVQSFVEGQWVKGQGSYADLHNAISGEKIGETSTEGINFKAVHHYARKTGGPALRALSFHQRARLLKALALYLTAHKDQFYLISAFTGATKLDSWIDIEGGIGNLFVMASKGRRELPDTPFHVEGKAEMLSKQGTFIGHHLCVPLEGVAIHINAFNFPVWGMLEKIACNLLAGVPAIVKPATATCYLTETVVRAIHESKILPEGSLQLLCGSVGDLFEHLDCQDVVTFTGSAQTGLKLKGHTNLLKHNVRFNQEADSLNFSVLGPDAHPGSAEFDLFIKELTKEMTIKAGQKCTAIRRAFIPKKWVEDVQKAMTLKLQKNIVGDPAKEGVRMGPLASLAQKKDVLEKIALLKKSSELFYGDEKHFEVVGADKNKGAFISPTLLYCEKPFDRKNQIHDIEAFGPVTTLMPYETTDDVIELAKKGGGSLCGSLITGDDHFAREVILATAAFHGRLIVINKNCEKESTGHGSPMPHLIHGGPGRAGGGEEMGGIRGIFHYMQRTAIQGHPTTITHITKQFQAGSEMLHDLVHPFKKYFEELKIGETLITHKRTVTETDIVNFANISGDNFYAHMDETSLAGSLFEKRVAHGYFIISAAAGLFVDPKKGPVLANYGLDELRFLKPVYIGATIGVRLTVKEKIAQEQKTPDDIPKGIVKWLVDVYDETGETVALATILTLVERKQAALS
jgi:oxepin-CoA hydrolase/3-oxo-5,6-dehydrosuberyl-CoA semialdehyde dehydrogenase